jgi:5-oxoprolinase (ATP-hydrolysing)
VTDANVFLGRIQPEFFPHVFGPEANESLDGTIAARRFAELAQHMTQATGEAISPEQAAAGALQIAVGSMANAVKRISVMRGYDVSGYTLQCFGGAAGQHACQVADALGMSRIFSHPLAGVLSAYGMGLADQIVMREAAAELELNDAGLHEARRLAQRLENEGREELRSQGLEPASGSAALRTVFRLHIRYQGTDTALGVELPMPGEPGDAVAAVREAFERAYRRRFAFLMPKQALVIESVTVECIAPGVQAGGDGAPAASMPGFEAVADVTVRMYCIGGEEPAGWRTVDLFKVATLGAGALRPAHATTSSASPQSRTKCPATYVITGSSPVRVR